jgi:hypothetical protein
MQKLQLYIEGQRVDLFKDETVSLTQTLQNVKDINKIFTEFTKTFAIPASSVNNKILKHYYNFNISSGDNTFAYDARNKQPATLELNDLPFKEGLIKLNGVKLKNNVAHTYNITFFGNTVNLKDILGSTQLSALQYPQSLNKIYSFGDVTNIMQNVKYDSDIIVPLITHTNRLIYDSGVHNVFDPEATINNIAHQGAGQQQQNGVEWNQFKYAIKLQVIIDAIQAETFVGGQTLTFSDDFFNDATNDDFNYLYLWLHRKKGAVESPAQVLQNFTQVTELGTTVCVPTNNCQPLTSNVSNGALALTAQSPYSISFLTLNVTPPNTTDQYTIRVIRNGSQVVGEVTGTGNKQLIIVPWNDSTYTVQIASSTNMVFPIGGIQWTVSWTTGSTGFNSNGQMIYSNAATFITTAFKEFNISEQMPKMTVIDFLTGLFKMFNLTAYVDGTGTIVVRTLDSYYASGSAIPINIDKYLDTTNSTVNVALPFKNIQFAYKGLGTLLAKRFEQENNLGWGTLSYSLDGDIFDAPTGSYKVELPFEHMQYERLYNAQGGAATGVQWGYFVDDNEEPYFGSPLIFYGIMQISTTNIRIRDTETTNVADIDTYFIPSNALALQSSTSKVNIHFGNEVNEYQAFQPAVDPLAFTDTLFYTKYRTYIRNVFDVSRRITKVTAYLPMKIYYNLQLNDLIQLGQENYKINSLTTNLTTGKTEFELLNDVQSALTTAGNPPSTVGGVTATNIGATSVTINWSPSVSPDGITMSYYVVLFNGSPVGGAMAQPLQTTYSDTITGLTTGTTYSVTIIAYDVLLDTSAPSTAITFITL